jgi:hypothetical protein
MGFASKADCRPSDIAQQSENLTLYAKQLNLIYDMRAAVPA